MKAVAGAPEQVEWRRLAEFSWPGAGALTAALAAAARDLALPEGVLGRVQAALLAAAPPAARADIVVRVLAAVPPATIRRCGWGFYQLRRLNPGPPARQEIEVCLFPER